MKLLKRPGLFKLLAAAGLLFFANRRWNERFVEAINISAPIRDEQGKKRYGRKIRVSSLFNATPDKVWQAVRSVDLLQQVSAPLLIFRPVTGKPLPGDWQEGTSGTFELLAFGLLPVGKHTINIVVIDEQRRYMFTNEHGDAAQIWNHQIWVAGSEDGRTLYTDEIDIYASFLTPAVAAFAYFFYRYRQTRWQALAPTL